MEMQRLDKIIASTGRWSRREVKALVRQGRVLVDGVVNFFRPLIAKGLPIHSIGMQAHMIYGDTDYITEYTNSIKKIASLGQFGSL